MPGFGWGTTGGYYFFPLAFVLFCTFIVLSYHYFKSHVSDHYSVDFTEIGRAF